MFLLTLAASAPDNPDEGSNVLRITVEQWYERLSDGDDERSTFFTTQELRMLPARGVSPWAPETHADCMHRMAILLRRFLETVADAVS